MADENENSAASGKFLLKFTAAGDKNYVDNAVTENSWRIAINIMFESLSQLFLDLAMLTYVTSENFQNFAGERK